MKPFNLEKFLAGEPAVSAGGHKVIDFHLFERLNKIVVQLEGIVGLITVHSHSGRLYPSFPDSTSVSDFDLQMETKTKEIKIGIYKYRDGSGYVSKIINGKDDDSAYLAYWTQCIKTITTTIEE